MKVKFFIILISILLFISACGQSQNTHEAPLPESDSAGGKIYKKFCSACHAPPRISSHKADEWLNIVERMQTHRIKKAYHPLNELEKETLVAYLQKHSTK